MDFLNFLFRNPLSNNSNTEIHREPAEFDGDSDERFEKCTLKYISVKLS